MTHAVTNAGLNENAQVAARFTVGEGRADAGAAVRGRLSRTGTGWVELAFLVAAE